MIIIRMLPVSQNWNTCPPAWKQILERTSIATMRRVSGTTNRMWNGSHCFLSGKDKMIITGNKLYKMYNRASKLERRRWPSDLHVTLCWNSNPMRAYGSCQHRYLEQFHEKVRFGQYNIVKCKCWHWNRGQRREVVWCPRWWLANKSGLRQKCTTYMSVINQLRSYVKNHFGMAKVVFVGYRTTNICNVQWMLWKRPTQFLRN